MQSCRDANSQAGEQCPVEDAGNLGIGHILIDVSFNPGRFSVLRY